MTLGKLIGALAIFIMVAIVGIKSAQASPYDDAVANCISAAELTRAVAELRDAGMPPENVISQLMAMGIDKGAAFTIVRGVYITSASVSPDDIYLLIGNICITEAKKKYTY